MAVRRQRGAHGVMERLKVNPAGTEALWPEGAGRRCVERPGWEGGCVSEKSATKEYVRARSNKLYWASKRWDGACIFLLSCLTSIYPPSASFYFNQPLRNAPRPYSCVLPPLHAPPPILSSPLPITTTPHRQSSPLSLPSPVQFPSSRDSLLPAFPPLKLILHIFFQLLHQLLLRLLLLSLFLPLPVPPLGTVSGHVRVA